MGVEALSGGAKILLFPTTFAALAILSKKLPKPGSILDSETPFVTVLPWTRGNLDGFRARFSRQLRSVDPIDINVELFTSDAADLTVRPYSRFQTLQNVARTAADAARSRVQELQMGLPISGRFVAWLEGARGNNPSYSGLAMSLGALTIVSLQAQQPTIVENIRLGEG